jgi:hypothetical protein
LIYLGRYLYRGVIREQDILACENGRVSFRYRNAQTGKSEKRSLTGADFLWLILQHVLPKGVMQQNCSRCRVEMWRGSRRFSLSVSVPFV